VILESRPPLFEDNLFGRGTDLSGYKLLEVADCVIGFALYAHFLAETVVAARLS